MVDSDGKIYLHKVSASKRTAKLKQQYDTQGKFLLKTYMLDESEYSS